MATNANPLGVFQTAIGQGQPVFDMGKALLERAQTQELQSRVPINQQTAQAQQLENRKTQQALEADQAVRDILKQHTANIPVTPPASNLPAPPMGPDGKPVLSPDYQAAQQASAAQVPDLDVGAAALALTKAGYGDRALTLLKTDQELRRSRADNTKAELANFESERSARADVLSGIVDAMHPDGLDKPATGEGVQKAAQLWGQLTPEERKRAGIPDGVAFDPNMIEAKYRQAAGAKGVVDAIKDHLEPGKVRAETENLKANTAKVQEETLVKQNQRKALEKILTDPESRDAEIEGIWSKADPTRTEYAKQQASFIARRGDPAEMEAFIKEQRQAASQFQSNLAERTNPSLLKFDEQRAYGTARASALGTASTFDPTAFAEPIANYQMRLGDAMARMPGTSRAEILKAVLAKNPNFQESNYDVAKRTEEAFTSGSKADLVRSNNNALEHLGLLHQAGQALKNGNIQVLNAVANEFGVQVGNDAKTTYDHIATRVGDEVTKAFIPGAGGEGERTRAAADYSSSLSPQQRESNIKADIHLMDSQQRNLTDQYKRGTYGRGTQQLYTDRAQQTRDALLGNQGTVKMKAPTGQVQDVPADQVDHYKQLGATVVK